MNLNDLLLELPLVIRNRFAANNFAQWIKMCNRAIAEINRTCAGPGRIITVSPRGNDERLLHVPKQIETVNAVYINGIEVKFSVKNRVILCKEDFPSVSTSGTADVYGASPTELFVQSSSIPFTPESGNTIELPDGILASALAFNYTTGSTLVGVTLINPIPDVTSFVTASIFKSVIDIVGYERTQPISTVNDTIILPDGYEGLMAAFLRYYAENQDDEGSRTATKWLEEAMRIKNQFMSIQTKAEGKSSPVRTGFGFRRAR